MYTLDKEERGDKAAEHYAEREHKERGDAAR